jgi:hypothetical protein
MHSLSVTESYVQSFPSHSQCIVCRRRTLCHPTFKYRVKCSGHNSGRSGHGQPRVAAWKPHEPNIMNYQGGRGVSGPSGIS